MALLRRKKVKPKPKKVCRTVKARGSAKKRKVCTTKPAKRPATGRRPSAGAPVPTGRPGLPVPSAAAPPIVTASPPAAPPAPPSRPAPVSPPKPPSTSTSTPMPTPEAWPKPTPAPPDVTIARQSTWGRVQAERLLWRAGFGPRPGDVDRFAAMSPIEAVRALTRPSGTASLEPADRPPRDENGNPLDPRSVWGHDHLWWLDRMVRSSQPLVERMTLIWHDWFATTNDDVGNQPLMLDQNELFRRNALGSFARLTLDVTTDPAMLVFLNGVENRRGSPNENYGRELMELFTLGADRGAYTETDVREIARALTGWDADWQDGWVNFRFVPTRQDTNSKTVFGRTGRWGWQDAVRLCFEHPLHASFFVRKLWSYFVPTAPSAATQAALEQLYVGGGFAVAPVVEAILLHPDLYGPVPLAKPPVVFVAGMLRARGKAVDHRHYLWWADTAGQQLFYPPSVAGWNDQGWLDTATLRGRWEQAWRVLDKDQVSHSGYSTTETPAQAVTAALAHWNNPTIGAETRVELERFAAAAIPAVIASWEQGHLRADRQNALRHLIVTSPDLQVC